MYCDGCITVNKTFFDTIGPCEKLLGRHPTILVLFANNSWLTGPYNILFCLLDRLAPPPRYKRVRRPRGRSLHFSVGQRFPWSVWTTLAWTSIE